MTLFFWIKTALALVVLIAGLTGAMLPWVLGARGASQRALARSEPRLGA